MARVVINVHFSCTNKYKVFVFKKREEIEQTF